MVIGQNHACLQPSKHKQTESKRGLKGIVKRYSTCPFRVLDGKYCVIFISFDVQVLHCLVT